MRPYTVFAIVVFGLAVFVGYRTSDPSSAPIVKAEPKSVPAQTTLVQAAEIFEPLSDEVDLQAPKPTVVENIAPQRAIIVLADGLEPIEVDVRRPRVPMQPESVGRLVDQYDELATAARGGDGAAARMLYVELKICEMHVQRPETASRRPTQSLAANEEPSESETRCEGVSDEHLSNSSHWAELAAKSGDYIGRQYYGAALGQMQGGLAAYESFWNDGNASALPAMAAYYGKGIEGGEPNWVKAYAASLIYFKLSEASQGMAQARGGHVRRFTHQAMGEHLHYLSGLLSPGQQQEAEALAHRMLANNTNCCTGSF